MSSQLDQEAMHSHTMEPSQIGRTSSGSESWGEKQSMSSYMERTFGAATGMFGAEITRDDWSRDRLLMASMVESPASNFFMSCIISLNTIFFIMETDIAAKEDNIPAWVLVTQGIFLGIYVIELAMRYYVHRALFWSSGWNIFDLLVVSLDILGEIVSRLGGDEVPSFGVLRIFRIGRLLRFVFKLTIFKDLGTMIKLMLTSVQTLLWGAFLMIIMTTGWAILAVMFLHPLNAKLADRGLYEGCERCGRAFESVFQANLTFCQQLIFGDSWGQVSLVLIENHPWTGIVIFLAGITVQVGLLNLILVVIVEKATEQHEHDVEEEMKEKVKLFELEKPTMKQMCSELDTDNSGLLSLSELEAGFLDNSEFAVTLNLLDLNAADIKAVFDRLDDDASGTVSHNEFIEQLYRLKTQGMRATLLCLEGKQNQISRSLDKHLDTLQGEIDSRIERLDLHVDSMQEAIDSRISELMSLVEKGMNLKSKSSSLRQGGVTNTNAARDVACEDFPLQASLKLVTQNIEGELAHGVQQILENRGSSVFGSGEASERSDPQHRRGPPPPSTQEAALLFGPDGVGAGKSETAAPQWMSETTAEEQNRSKQQHSGIAAASFSLLEDEETLEPEETQSPYGGDESKKKKFRKKKETKGRI